MIRKKNDIRKMCNNTYFDSYTFEIYWIKRWQHSVRIISSVDVFSIHWIHSIKVTIAAYTLLVMLKATFLSLAVIAFGANLASGLYFHLTETKKKCFVSFWVYSNFFILKSFVLIAACRRTWLHYGCRWAQQNKRKYISTLYLLTRFKSKFTYSRWHFEIEIDEKNIQLNWISLFLFSCIPCRST